VVRPDIVHSQVAWNRKRSTRFKHWSVIQLCSLVVVVLLSDGRIQWGFYTVIYIGVIMLVVFTALTLLLYYFDVHRGSDTLPWTPIVCGHTTVNRRSSVCRNSASTL
jgi:hypothetical protein